jgi:hypothetical protein
MRNKIGTLMEMLVYKRVLIQNGIIQRYGDSGEDFLLETEIMIRTINILGQMDAQRTECDSGESWVDRDLVTFKNLAEEFGLIQKETN